MSAAVMTERRAAEASPRSKARMAGVLYVLTGATSVFAEFIVLGRLVVAGDAAATATNVLAHDSLFRLWFAAALLAVACHIAYTVLFYDVFKPVHPSLALLAAFVLLVGCTMGAVASLFQIASVVVLTGGGSLSVFPIEQAQTLALTSLDVNAQAYDIFLVFFGFYLLLIGYLIIRSTFLPRILGVLVAFVGVGYLTLLSPPLAHELSPFNLAPAALGEPSLMLWLLLVGVNAPRWKEQAAAAAGRPEVHEGCRLHSIGGHLGHDSGRVSESRGPRHHLRREHCKRGRHIHLRAARGTRASARPVRAEWSYPGRAALAVALTIPPCRRLDLRAHCLALPQTLLRARCCLTDNVTRRDLLPGG